MTSQVHLKIPEQVAMHRHSFTFCKQGIIHLGVYNDSYFKLQTDAKIFINATDLFESYDEADDDEEESNAV